MKTKAILFALVLLVSAIPSAAGAEYKGSQLGRPAVADFTLVDQNGENFSFHTLTGDAIVVSFIFTRCVDTCPIITQKLKSLQTDIDDSLKVNFISISVDPQYDTPERLSAYMTTHGVEWPHLTGDITVVEPVWDAFIVQAEQQELPPEDNDNHEEINHDEHNHEEMDGMGVIIVNESGVANEYEVQPSGYHLLEAAAYEANWSLNISTTWGHFANGFNGVDSPSDWSWWWEVHTWDESNSTWLASTVGLDDINAFNHSILAFAPNNTADSEIPVPIDENASITLVYPNGSNESVALPEISGWHMTASVLDSAGVNFSTPDSEWGHFMESIDNESSEDWSWWWQLHTWDMENNTWVESSVGMDSLVDQAYIAWAPNSTADSNIPAPAVFAIDPDNYAVGHSTMTYILDDDFKPMVAWSGSDWNVADVVADVHMVAKGVAVIDIATNSGESGLPGFTFAIIASALGLAIIATSRED
jgi:protein SCO1/2